MSSEQDKHAAAFAATESLDRITSYSSTSSKSSTHGHILRSMQEGQQGGALGALLHPRTTESLQGTTVPWGGMVRRSVEVEALRAGTDASADR